MALHQTLYRKWRPRTFDEVSGQDRTTAVLKYEIANGRTAHAYLFCGSRGTGKTSCAKIFAKAINCLDPKDGNPCGECEACRAVAAEATTDIIEMDAASNNGVDYIRDIRDQVVYAPAMLKYKVFIIDEVHMLSASAFNALLKTLEEPPERVIFILATTEVNKLPVTVVSRCQRFDFNRISIDDISKRLHVIAEAEKIPLDDSAARLIAKLARGGMRDAVSLLELCAGEDGKVDVARVNRAAGISPRDRVERTLRAVVECDRAAIFDEIGAIYSSSLDINEFWQQLIEYCRDLMVVKVNKNAAAYLELTDDEIASLTKEAKDISFDKLALYAGMLDETLTNLQKGTYDNRVLAEMTLVRMATRHPGNGVEALAARIGELEERLAKLESGTPVAPAKKSVKKPKATEPEASVKVPEPSGAEAEDDKPPFVIDAPEAPAKEPPEPVPMPEKPEPAAAADPDDGVTYWADVLENIAKKDVSTAGFLSGTYAVKDEAGKRLTVCVPDEFSILMLETQEVKDRIASAVAEVDPSAAGYAIAFEVRAAGKTGNAMDEFLD